jgi:threonine dehydratase
LTSFSLISDTYEKIYPHILKTPLIESKYLSQRLKKRVFIKAECLQHTGSFKYRGSWSAFTNINKSDLRNGVLAYSSGNHAQGVASVAQQLGIRATIIMPIDAPKLKIKNTKAYGAEVVFYDREKESREDIGCRLEKDMKLKLIKPYDDPFIIAGQGTLGIELANQTQKLGIKSADVLVCCGGGGLSSGISLALDKLCKGFRVRTCEPEKFDDMSQSLKLKKRVKNEVLSGSICDAILTPTPGEITFKILLELAGSGLVANDKQVLEAMSLLFLHHKLVVEPGGAISLAAAFNEIDKIQAESIIIICSGGNVDPKIFSRALKLIDV